MLMSLFLFEAVNIVKKQGNSRGKWVGLYFYRVAAEGGGPTES